jgi:hypothetical protein
VSSPAGEGTVPRGLWLLALLLLSPGQEAVAGPPEGPSARMTVDPVADGLLRYHKEKDPQRQRALLWKLAPTADPRVAVALGEALASYDLPYPELMLLAEHHLPAKNRGSTDAVWDWWRENEADLRRRAKELP